MAEWLLLMSSHLYVMSHLWWPCEIRGSLTGRGSARKRLSRHRLVLIALNLAYNRNKLFKTLYHWSRDKLKFDFLEKGLGIASPSHFVYHFSRKMFLVLHPINWSNLIVWLSFLLEISASMCIQIIYQPDCDVIKFEINHIFLIKLL